MTGYDSSRIGARRSVALSVPHVRSPFSTRAVAEAAGKIQIIARQIILSYQLLNARTCFTFDTDRRSTAARRAVGVRQKKGVQ